MKLKPWLRSLRNGIARTFTKATPKRRDTKSAMQIAMVGQGAELLEDRTVLNAVIYHTTYSDGVYDAGNFLQPQPGAPVPLQLSPGGRPAIPIDVIFVGNVTIQVVGQPQIFFNTASADPTAPNYTGSVGVATYYGGSGTFGSLRFWYEIQNGENTAGPTRPELQSYLHVIGGTNNGSAITDGAGSVQMSVIPPANANFSHSGEIVDSFDFSKTKFIFIDTHPVVQNIDASPSYDSIPYNIDPSQGAIHKPYRVGDPPISIQVTFSEPVAVSGTPELVLNTNGVFGQQNNDSKAIYKSGSGTNVLTFEYTVAPGDNSFDLDVASALALTPPSGTLIRDQDFVQDAAITTVVGPSLGGLIPGTLGRNRTIQVDTLAPLVGPRPDDPPGASFVGVTSLNANGTYGAGQTITIRISYNEAVVLTGSPTLVLATGPVNREATFAGFDGTDTLLFTYTIQAGDLSPDLDYVGPDSLKLNGGSLTDLAGNPANLLLPTPGAAGSLSFNKAIVIDTVVAVTNVTTLLPNGSYGIGQVIPIQVVFNKEVTVFGIPQLVLDLNAPVDSVVVDYSFGSGTKILTFNYTIQAGHNTLDLDYVSSASLLLNGGQIVDTIGNGNAQLALPLPGSAGSLGANKDILIDTNLPIISDVSAAASVPNGTYVAGQTIPITVKFNEPVSVSGIPQLTLDTNGIPGVQPFLTAGQIADAVINYTSGSGTNTLTFNYTIAEGQNSLDLDALFLTLANGSKIKDLAGNDIAPTGSLLTLPQFPNEVLNNSNVQPNVAPVAQVVDIIVGNVVANNVYAFTINGFNVSYTATAGDTQSTVASRLRQAVNNASGFLNVSATGFTNSVRLTSTQPGAAFTVNIAPGSQLTQAQIQANGLPQTQIDTLNVVSVSNGSVYDFTINGVTFTYTANGTDTIGTVAGKLRDLINTHVTIATQVSASALNGVVTIQAVNSGVPFTLSTGHSLAGIRNLVIDTAPVITNITSTAPDGTYVAGDTIAITITFTENVVVDTTLGIPSLLLETNGVAGAQPGSDAQAQYNSGSGTNTLTFLYTIQAGQTTVDLEYAGVTALQLNGGTIKDVDGVPANLNPALRTPGTVGSLSRNKDIQIDDTAKNDPPVNIVPGVQTTTEDVVGGLVFSVGNGNLIQIKDVDAGVGDLVVTLTAARGTINIPNTTNLAVSPMPASVVTITGTLANINAALNGLTFIPAPNANSSAGGPISLTVSTDDQGFTGGGSLVDTDVIPINVVAVNDIPTPVNQTVQTAVGTSVTVFLQANDPDVADNISYVITTAPSHGTLSLITGVNQVVYTPTPGYVGPDSFAFAAKDAVSTSVPGLVTVNVVPTVPAIVGFPDVLVVEGNSGTVNAVFTITLSQPAAFLTTIDYATSAIDAIANVDYVTTAGQVSFAIGEQTKTITIPIQGDLNDEPNETFAVNLTNPVNVILQDAQAIGTIQNDDGLSIDDVSAFEGDSGTTIFTFHVRLSSASGQQVSVNYATSSGTASSPSDFTAPSNGSIVFAPGEQDKTITVAVKGDTLNESDETFSITLSSPSGASLGKSVGVGTILNDDTAPSVSIGDVSISEGNSGTKTLTFNAILSSASGQTVTANYATSDNTAINGTDYLGASGTITFAPGITTVPIQVTIIGDQVFEADETFQVTLSNIVGAQAGDVIGTGTIVNDDGFTINDVSIIEGDTGTKLLVFTVNAPQIGGATSTIDFTVVPGAVNPATPNSDYTPVSGTLSFPSGVTSRTISIPIVGDYLQEQNETINVVLSNAQSTAIVAPILKSVGVGTITDNDVTPVITVTDVQIVEGNSGTKNAVFVLTLSQATGIPITVNYEAQSLQGTDNATAGADYVPVTGTVTFAAFQTTATVNVPILGDILDEPTETFRLHLSQAVNASLGQSPTLDAIATINDDDPTPTITINDLSVNEGQAGQTSATFTVSLSAPSGQDITVHYKTASGTAKSGVIPGDNSSNDFVEQEGDLTFVAGVTSQPITIAINGDIRFELDETFVINLSAPVNAGLVDSQGVATIVNDDPKPTIVIDDVTVFEGNSGLVPMTFTIKLLQESALPATVSYATSSGTAQDGNDYQSASGTVTFLPGETVKQITVNAIGDENVEADENFFINLSSATNAVISDALGVGTIRNDDVLPSISVDDVSVTEGDSGTKLLTFTITRSSANSASTTVQYSTSNGTATAGGDFNLTQGTVTFQPNETVKTVSVPIIGDTTAENNETFFLNLSNPVNATIADGQGVGTILNDDNAPPIVTVPIGPLPAVEDTDLSLIGLGVTDADAGGAPITVTLTAQHGTLLVANNVPGGLSPFQIVNNGSGTVTLNAPVSVINTTLANALGVVYRGNQDYSGIDSVTITANDLGNTGNVVIPKSDTKTVSINVEEVNDPPTVDFHGAAGVGTPATPVPSTKGNAVAAFGSPNVITLSDPDNGNFSGGTIVVKNLGPFIGKKDKISIRNQGKNGGQIGFKRGKITYGGVEIGTASGGLKDAPFVIELNNKATVPAVQALMRNILFGTSRAQLVAEVRTLSLVMTDGDGAESGEITTAVNVTN